MRRLAPLVLVLGLLAAGFALASRQVSLRGDIADFLPAAQTDEAAFLLRELREGAGTRLLLQSSIYDAFLDRLVPAVDAQGKDKDGKAVALPHAPQALRQPFTRLAIAAQPRPHQQG